MRYKIESYFLISDSYGSGPYCRERDVHKLESDYEELEDIISIQKEDLENTRLSVTEFKNKLRIAVDGLRNVYDCDNTAVRKLRIKSTFESIGEPT